ncbi:MAG: acyl-CoA thioesterase [Flavobacteriaceae bacterium]|nr:acyl-CoA thioesterase [Flavobacteriaceae bacterium]
MQTFEKTLTVTVDDLDELEHVNNVQYVHWVMDIAKSHWLNNATPALLKNYFWVLVSHHIDYKSSAVLNDTILLKSYVTQAEGVSSTRLVEMYHKQSNRLLVTSETKWCLMDAKTKRPTRITEELANLFN